MSDEYQLMRAQDDVDDALFMLREATGALWALEGTIALREWLLEARGILLEVQRGIKTQQEQL